MMDFQWAEMRQEDGRNLRENSPARSQPRRGGFQLGGGDGGFRFGGGGAAEVADDAGGGPGTGEGGAGLGAAEAEDEAVHLFEELADFREAGAEGDGERAAAR